MQAQSIPQSTVVVYYYHAWIIWLIFFGGETIHALLQIDDISRRTKKKRRDVFYEAWIRILYRAAACVVVFGIIWLYPTLLTVLIGLFGINLSPAASTAITFPMNNVLALAWGLVLDSVLGYIPVLSSHLPVVDVPIQAALAEAKAATDMAGQKIAQAQTQSADLPPKPEDPEGKV